MRLAFSLLLFLASGLLPIASADSIAALEIQGKLTEVRGREDLESVGGWLESRRIDPLEAAAALRQGPSYPPVEASDLRIDVVARDGRETVARVLVPGGYDPARPTPLLVALHGYRADEDQLVGAYRWASERGWLLAFPAARPCEEWSDPAISLITRTTGDPWWDYGPEGVVLATLDEVRRRFNVDEDRIVLSGFSMGGFASWNVGLRHHPLFAGIAPISGALTVMEYTGLKDVRSRRLLANARDLAVFFLHGEADRIVPPEPDRWSHEELVRLGIPHVFRLIAGGSHWPDLFRGRGEEYAEFQRWLEACRRDPAPRRSVHVAIDDDHRVGSWVEILEGDFGREPARIEAHSEGNRIEVRTERVERLRIYLYPGEFDPEAPVTVLLDGEEAFRGKVAPSHDAVLASWWAYRGDRRKVTAYAIELGR